MPVSKSDRVSSP